MEKFDNKIKCIGIIMIILIYYIIENSNKKHKIR